MAAASAASFAASFSALSVDSRRQNSQFLSSRKFPFPLSKLTPTTVLSTPAPRLPSLRASSDFKPVDPEEINDFDPTMEEYDELSEFDEDPLESEDEIARAYEEIYGPAYSGESFLGNDVYVMDSKLEKSKNKNEKVKDGFEETVVQVRRVTKVVKGGKQLRFRAIVVVGDKEGNVGVGVGKAKEVVDAVQKSAVNARRNIITVPMTKYKTFPHRSEAKYGAAKVMLRPAAPGTGVIAGGAVRIVLEMAGVENALGKQLGSNNALNNARATVEAVLKMRQFSEVAEERGIPMEQLWK